MCEILNKLFGLLVSFTRGVEIELTVCVDTIPLLRSHDCGRRGTCLGNLEIAILRGRPAPVVASVVGSASATYDH